MTVTNNQIIASLAELMVTDATGNIAGIKSEAIIAEGDANLGDIGNVKIFGGTSGQVISTDGVGGLVFIDGPDINNFKPTGINSTIQMNYGGSFGADANLYFDAANRVLYTPEISTDGFRIGNITGANVAGVVRAAQEAYRVDAANIVGTIPVSLSATTINGANVIGPVANALVADFARTANIANFVSQTAQANITQVGVLSNLSAGDIAVSGNIQVANTLNTLNFQVNQYANLGPTSNIAIFGGTAGQYLQSGGSGIIQWQDLTVTGEPKIQFVAATSGANLIFQSAALNAYDTAGNMTLLKDGVLMEADVDYVKTTGDSVRIIAFTTQDSVVDIIPITGYNVGGGGSGGGNVAGANTQVQYNDAGSLGAAPSFTFNVASGLLTAPRFSGSGANLTALPAANIAGIVAAANNANFAITAGNANVALTVEGANVTGVVPFSSVSYNVALANVSGAGNVAAINLNGNGSQVLAGNGAWISGGGGSGGTAAGNTGEIQFNNLGTFAADSNIKWDSGNTVFTVTGTVAGNIKAGGNVGELMFANANGFTTTSARHYIGSNGIGGIVASRDAAGASFIGMQYTNTAIYTSQLNLRARGTKAAPLPVQVGDRILSAIGYAYTGNSTGIIDTVPGWATSHVNGVAVDLTSLPTSPTTAVGTAVRIIASNSVANTNITSTFSEDGNLTIPGTFVGNVKAAGTVANIAELQFGNADGVMTSSNRYYISANGAGGITASRDSAAATLFSVTYNNLNALNSYSILQARARGTKAAPLPVQVGDQTFGIGSFNYTGNGTATIDNITGWVASSPLAGQVTALPVAAGGRVSSNVTISTSNAVSNSVLTCAQFDSDRSTRLFGNVIMSGTVAPASSTSTGTAGQVAFDGQYIYYCVSTNLWTRAPMTTW